LWFALVQSQADTVNRINAQEAARNLAAQQWNQAWLSRGIDQYVNSVAQAGQREAAAGYRSETMRAASDAAGPGPELTLQQRWTSYVSSGRAAEHFETALKEAATWSVMGVVGGLPGAGAKAAVAAGERGVLRGAAKTVAGEAKFLGQGFNRVQAGYLAEPYEGMGHHFLRREWGLPEAITDSRFSVLKPPGISRGDFYGLHYQVDPTFYGAAFPQSVGGSWSGSAIGLEKYGFFGRIWYGSPTPLKFAVGGAAATGGGAAYWYFNQDNRNGVTDFHNIRS
jgi:hypothetical protein